MTDDSAPRSPARLLSEWAGVAGLAFVVAGYLWNGGSTSSAVQQQTADNTRRIERLEVSDQKKTDQLATIQAVAARTEAKVDLLLGRKEAP